MLLSTLYLLWIEQQVVRYDKPMVKKAEISMPYAKKIAQQYWSLSQFPFMELRSTEMSSLPYKTHYHTQFSIGAIFHGATCTQYQGKSKTLHVGDIILIPPFVPHNCNPLDGKPRSYAMMYLDVEWSLSQLSLLFGKSVPLIHCKDVVVRDAQLFCFYQHIVRGFHTGNHEHITQVLFPLLSTLFRYCCLPASPDLSQHEITPYLRMRLSSNLLNPPALDSLAQETGLRKETLIRLFQRDTGMTPISFLNNMRIEQAKILLREGYDIADVGYQTGFSDQSHFHKAFVSHTASTPGQYQKSTINF